MAAARGLAAEEADRERGDGVRKDDGDDAMHDERGRPLTLAQAARDLHDAGGELLATTGLPRLAAWLLDRMARGIAYVARRSPWS